MPKTFTENDAKIFVCTECDYNCTLTIHKSVPPDYCPVQGDANWLEVCDA